jgi:hypothetical protein
MFTAAPEPPAKRAHPNSNATQPTPVFMQSLSSPTSCERQDGTQAVVVGFPSYPTRRRTSCPTVGHVVHSSSHPFAVNTILHRELGMSKGAAFYRKTAAELVQRFPEVVEPLRDGRLCITTVIELAKVITPENREEVLPRFFHRSKSEAKAVSAALAPDEAPARREVVTRVRAEEARPHAVQPVELIEPGSGGRRRAQNPVCGLARRARAVGRGSPCAHQ